MTFTYEATLLCNCRQGSIGSSSATSPKLAEQMALSQATLRGWLQIGDRVWCPQCINQRANEEAIEPMRKGQFIPIPGMHLVFVGYREGIPPGHRMAAIEAGLKLDEVYEVLKVLAMGHGVMISLTIREGYYFNVGMFEEVKG